MWRHVLIFGLVGGVLVTLLKLIEYKYLVIEHSIEIYGGLIAATFAVLGIWLGIRLTVRRTEVVVKEVSVRQVLTLQDGGRQAARGEPFVLNERKREELGITPRELEILALVAEGLSNREIAGKLFVSENTVKTHCSRAFDKLGAKRRTQAVQLGKELGLLAETGRPNG
jgi:DNA-binding CsgD family transcriptional regulator